MKKIIITVLAAMFVVFSLAAAYAGCVVIERNPLFMNESAIVTALKSNDPRIADLIILNKLAVPAPRDCQVGILESYGKMPHDYYRVRITASKKTAWVMGMTLHCDSTMAEEQLMSKCTEAFEEAVRDYMDCASIKDKAAREQCDESHNKALREYMDCMSKSQQ